MKIPPECNVTKETGFSFPVKECTGLKLDLLLGSLPFELWGAGVQTILIITNMTGSRVNSGSFWSGLQVRIIVTSQGGHSFLFKSFEDLSIELGCCCAQKHWSPFQQLLRTTSRNARLVNPWTSGSSRTCAYLICVSLIITAKSITLSNAKSFELTIEAYDQRKSST